MDSFNTLSKLRSKMTNNYVLAATAALILRKQFEREELQHTIQNSFGPLTTKLRSMKQDVHKILNMGQKVSQGNQFY
jgi:hypothetical protein